MKTFLGIIMLILMQAAQADVNTQAQTMAIINPGNTSNFTVGTDPNLSYQMMSNETGVGRELILLKAREAGEANNAVTTGGGIETNATSGSGS